MNRKVRTIFRCTSCGAGAPKWAGRCSSCAEWNSLVEELDGPAVPAAALSLVPSHPAVPVGKVDPADGRARPTQLVEFDRVLGGGLVPGSVTLLGGEPGIGKSTLLLQLLGAVAAKGRRALLVTGEESGHQVRVRAERLGVIHEELWIASETALSSVLGHLDVVRPEVMVVDSIQTMADTTLASSPGSVGQVRECAAALVRAAKERDVAIVLVGHVTKEGSLAGPRVLEHLVDTVLSFEGDRHQALRLLRAVKHRFGATGELGVFEMVEAGLVPVADPSSLFLGDRRPNEPGSVVTATMDGHRPLLVEVQALVEHDSKLPVPRRSAQGLDAGRMSLLVAVLSRRAHIGLGRSDVFASVAGGVRIDEPAADLGVALAIASAAADVALPPELAVFGEIGLAGEIRQVTHQRQRLTELARMGFSSALVPASTPAGEERVVGIDLLRVSSLREVVSQFRLRTPRTQQHPE